MNPGTRRLLAGAAVAGVLGLLVVGLVLIGPPSEARARRLDERRLEDLQGASSAIDRYHERLGHLPATLEVLMPEIGGAKVARDPVTGQPYMYRVIDATRYELCATFDRPSDDEAGSLRRWSADWSWAHPAGRHCFALESRVRRPSP